MTGVERTQVAVWLTEARAAAAAAETAADLTAISETTRRPVRRLLRQAQWRRLLMPWRRLLIASKLALTGRRRLLMPWRRLLIACKLASDRTATAADAVSNWSDRTATAADAVPNWCLTGRRRLLIACKLVLTDGDGC